MKTTTNFFISFLFFCLINLCDNTTKNKNGNSIVVLQPFSNFQKDILDALAQPIQKTYDVKIFINQPIHLPKSAFTNLKTPRYRADSLLKFLQKTKPSTTNYIVGLTEKDISVTKRNEFGKIKDPISKYNDFGVFGLGFCPGNACIISTFRLKSNHKSREIQRLKKVLIHEFGHNVGLSHCDAKQCVMHDAVEKLSTVDSEPLSLCIKCKKKILKTST